MPQKKKSLPSPSKFATIFPNPNPPLANLMKQICENCGEIIEKPEHAYRMKIELFADPSPPVFTEEDIQRDIKAEMEALIEQMKQVDPREAQDQVYESYLFTLCSHCRGIIHTELRRRQAPFEPE